MLPLLPTFTPHIFSPVFHLTSRLETCHAYLAQTRKEPSYRLFMPELPDPLRESEGKGESSFISRATSLSEALGKPKKI